MKNEEFIHLHIHSEYSILDGAIPIEKLLQKVKTLGMDAVAITDHGNMFGAIQFYKTAQQWGVKPIIGCEVYIAPTSRLSRRTEEVPEASFHGILLVKDKKGYKNLMKLCTAAYLEGFYYKPRIDKELLSLHREGLIFLSGCIKGEIPYYTLKGEEEKAKKAIFFFKEVFGEDFYLEIQDNGLEEQRRVIDVFINLSKKYNIGLVATNDVHYLEKEDARIHDVLLCIQTLKHIEDEDRLKFSTQEFYLRTPKEMHELFLHLPEALKNTLEIGEKCNLSIEFGTLSIPHIAEISGKEEDFLRQLCYEGARKRFGQINDEIKERLEYELSVIEKTKFAPYFLIVWDIVRYAKDQGIPVGPGRGSCAGSLVAYTLGITDIDPLKYGLLFERFLNEERVSMPDIDIDFCYEKRDKVLEYVRKKYGEEKVAHIITFGTMLARAVIRDVGRALNIPYKEVDAFAKLIPPYTTLDEALLYVKELQEIIEKDTQKKRLFEIARALEGLVRHPSTHAAGIVISKEPLTENVPLYKDPKVGVVATQYSKDCIEAIGLLKMDFLGLRTLTLIEDTVRLIRKKGEEFDISKISLEDKKTFSLLSEAETLGVFQLESAGMREILRRLKPQCFEDIIAVLALHRPGPLQSGMVEEFIKNKQKKEITYLHPSLEPILKETYGVIVYQEQVMQIAKELAGFSLTQADELRKAMGKKIKEKMEKAKSFFIEGAKAKGVQEKVAEQIFDLMSKFAEYGFNKSHSAAYALLSYRTAYLKVHYPLEFMASLLTSEMNDTEKLALYVNECKRMGIRVLPPDINESEEKFIITEDGAIRYALSAIKNVGVRAIECILEARKHQRFSSFTHFLESVDTRCVNKKVVEYLIKAGAFDSLHPNRAALLEAMEKFAESPSKTKKKLYLQPSLFASSTPEEEIPKVPHWSHQRKSFFEKEALGFYLSEHPLLRHKRDIEYLANTSITELQKATKDVRIVCILNSLKRKKTKNKKMMAFLSVEDLTGRAEVILFPEVFEKIAEKIEKDKILLIKGKVEHNEDEEPKILAEDVLTIDEAYRLYSSLLHIYLNTAEVSRLSLQKLRLLLDEYKGECPIHLHFKKNGRVYKILEPAGKVGVCEKFLDEVERLFGRENIKVEVK